MYLYTLSTSVFEIENADADCCYANLSIHNLLSWINFAELSAIIVSIVSSEIFDNGIQEDAHVQDWREYYMFLN
ncbi:MAG: hypothetical protein BGP13_06580 [Sphingobacteriales bacterium 40-81]|nr:MAG: hypothetical protein BGP13_06580 [Sphingobacteriales bacterium 40-81]